VPKGTHDWARFLTPQELALLGEEAGLVLRHVAGMVPSLTGRDFVLGSSLAVNYIAQFDKRAPAADVQQEAEEERR
jgi:2-polyprenyl-3-methyl-5-hydroxy-6-metoxy-1,4-benzoquinol methylase